MEKDSEFMAEAIALAAEGIGKGDGGPFGALIVHRGEIVGRGWNQVVSHTDPTAHAEMVAIRAAAARLGRFHLHGATLYTSCEPCPMCLAAAYWAHIDRIVYAADAADAAAIGFDDAFIYNELALPLPHRQLPLEQIGRAEALEVFRHWHQDVQRVDY